MVAAVQYEYIPVIHFLLSLGVIHMGKCFMKLMMHVDTSRLITKLPMKGYMCLFIVTTQFLHTHSPFLWTENDIYVMTS